MSWNNNNIKDDPFFKNFKPISLLRKRTNTFSGKNSWTNSYFYHILQLKSLIEDRVRENYPDFELDLHEFVDFLYHTSSGKIDPYLDDLTEDVQSIFFQYLVHKN